MSKKQRTKINFGGVNAFNWKAFGIVLPFLILENPVTENFEGDWWVFWRLLLGSLLAAIPLVIFYALGDFYFFPDREKKPMPNWLALTFGFLCGAIFGLSISVTSVILRTGHETFVKHAIEHIFSSGFTLIFLLPITYLISQTLSIYSDDRQALISERMLVESQKSESKAVIESLKSSLSNKVDENLLRVIENSQEFFQKKGRTLEENWELMAVQLRKAALETIRPFSHNLHRKGVEKIYKIKPDEFFRYIAYRFEIHVFLTVFVYFTLTYHKYFIYDDLTKGFTKLGIRILVLTAVLAVLKLARKIELFRNLWGFTILLSSACYLFTNISQRININFGLPAEGGFSLFLEFLTLLVIILLISFGMAFINGGHAEVEFLEQRISEEQLETMLLRREEARISRELAKYLHGTIQSRLMASAIGVESAGRRGDKKALQREVKQAYKNLKVPSASYFSNPETTINAEMKKVIAKWKDLMAIRLTIAKNVKALPDQLIQDIGNAVNEALSNAFRHGSASNVLIKISAKSTFLEIEVADDGSGPGKGRNGLGSEWFDALAGNNWSLSPNAKGGATLHLLIPIKN